jgi:cholesterol transport system auxiliary component
MRAALALAVLAGCALVRSSKPADIRYFAPEPLARASAPVRARDLKVRIGRVEPSTHLRERIAYRASSVEVALYDERRWTDAPDIYVRRAVERSLFDRRGVEQTFHRDGPELEIEVVGFEEVVAPLHTGRVQLRYQLRDRDVIVARGTLTAERPVAGDGFAPVVASIGEALDEVAEQLAEIVVNHLRT